MDSNGLLQGWRWARLGDVCEINPSRKDKTNFPDEMPVTFAPMSSIDETTGSLFAPIEKPFGEVRKGYTWFLNDDVLWAKITPCMENGKAFIARELINGVGFASTEFHVLRPTDQIISELIWYFVRQESFRDIAAHYFTGAVGQQRVPENFLREQVIPLPPLPEQRRIAARLNEIMAEIARARAAAQNALNAAKTLPAAQLRAVFESEEAKRWKEKELNDLVASQPHAVKRGPFGSSLKKEFFVPYGYKVYEQSHAIKNDFEIGTYYIDEEKFREMRDFAIHPNDVIISCSGTIGKVAIVPPDAQPGIINQALLKLTLNQNIILPIFFKMVFESVETVKQLGGLSIGSGLKNVASVKFLKMIRIRVPPLEEQRSITLQFETQMQNTRNIRAAAQTQLDAINALPVVYLRRAFRGEL